MKRTVQQPQTARPVKKEQFEDWAKKEITPSMRDLYDFANMRYTALANLTTAATGVPTTIWSEEMPDNSSWVVNFSVAGRATAGGAARANYQRIGLFYREAGGVATQEGATVNVVMNSSVGGFLAAFAVSGNNVTITVLDDAVRTMRWQVIAEVQEVTR